MSGETLSAAAVRDIVQARCRLAGLAGDSSTRPKKKLVMFVRNP